MTPVEVNADTHTGGATFAELANALKLLESKARVVPFTAQACIELNTKLATLQSSLAALESRVLNHELDLANQHSSAAPGWQRRLLVPAIILVGLGAGAGALFGHQWSVADRPAVATKELRISAWTGSGQAREPSSGGNGLGVQLPGASAISPPPDFTVSVDRSAARRLGPDDTPLPDSTSQSASPATPASPQASPIALSASPIPPTVPASVADKSQPDQGDKPKPAVEPNRDAPRQDTPAGQAPGANKAGNETPSASKLASAVGQLDLPRNLPAPVRAIMPPVFGLPGALDLPAADGPAARPARTDPSNAKIVIRATGTAWVEVRAADGRPIVSRLLHKDETWVPPDEPGLVLMTGNAGGIEILVDGVALPPLGHPGDIRKNITLNADALKAHPEACKDCAGAASAGP